MSSLTLFDLKQAQSIDIGTLLDNTYAWLRNSTEEERLSHVRVPTAGDWDGVTDRQTFMDYDGAITIVAGERQWVVARGVVRDRHMWDFAGDLVIVPRDGSIEDSLCAGDSFRYSALIGMRDNRLKICTYSPHFALFAPQLQRRVPQHIEGEYGEELETWRNMLVLNKHGAKYDIDLPRALSLDICAMLEQHAYR